MCMLGYAHSVQTARTCDVRVDVSEVEDRQQCNLRQGCLRVHQAYHACITSKENVYGDVLPPC